VSEDFLAPGPHGGIPLRLFDAGPGAPILVWMHGGGFSGGDLDLPQVAWAGPQLAARGVSVLAVRYRLAGPGNFYPVPSDDVLAAWEWARGRHPGDLVIGGASAGGNLAAGVALRLLRAGERMPDGLLLAYPTLHAVQRPTPSDLAAKLRSLEPRLRFDADAIRAMYERYLGRPIETADDIAVPGLATALTGMPRTLIIDAELDNLSVSGEQFAESLAADGVEVERIVEPGVLHGHLNRPEEPRAAASLHTIAEWMTR
jgi:acetyl esterase